MIIPASAKIPPIPDSASRIFDQNDINAALDALANRISADLVDTKPLVLSVMQGGLIIAGHLLTRLNFPLHQDYIHASRYQGNTNGGELDWIAKPNAEIKGRTVLLLDDIFDEGLTLAALNKWCVDQGAETVKSAVLVSKDHQRQQTEYRPDYSALTVDDRYVFGFGMDFGHGWRNLHEIYAIG